MLRRTWAHLDREVLSANAILKSARDCVDQIVLLVLKMDETVCV